VTKKVVQKLLKICSVELDKKATKLPQFKRPGLAGIRPEQSVGGE